MKHTFETKVYYADTDAYGVVWHGAYLRWLEAGRVELCELLGIDLKTLISEDVLLPVTNMNLKYKMSAKLDDNIVISSWISKFNGFSVTFKQQITEKSSGKVCIEAEFDVVAISNSTKRLYRRMPVKAAEIFEKEVKCLQSV